MMTGSRTSLSILLCLCSGYASAAPMAEIMVIPKGAIEVRSGTGDWQKIESPTPLTPGQEVRTDDVSTAEIDFSDGSKMALAQNTQFAVEKADRKESLFNLTAGKIRTYFAGLFSSRFNIHTSNAVCSVRGTVFDMSVGGGKTDMSVTEGHLEVYDDKGGKAVVTSEESIHVGANGLEEPRLISLNDSRALPAARPTTVQAEIARDRARAMVEELRNRELKANEAQLGKDAIDAFGNRVRIEEYALRPSRNEFELVFLSIREKRFDYGHLLETFNGNLPNDFSQIPAVFRGSFFSPTAPSNWIKNFEFFASNTVDGIKETIAYGQPVPISFSGFGGGTLYYPSSIDYQQILSGPGVPGGQRTQFELLQTWSTTFPGKFSWEQNVIDVNGALSTLQLLTLDPTSAVNIAAGGSVVSDKTCTGGYSLCSSIDPVTTTSFPSGVSKADFLTTTNYRDGSSVSSEKLMVSNEGNILDFSNPNANSFSKSGNFNLELIVGSNLFQGRNIDVLIAPEILSQKQHSTTTANNLQP